MAHWHLIVECRWVKLVCILCLCICSYTADSNAVCFWLIPVPASINWVGCVCEQYVWLVVWHSGRTSVSDRWTFPVLRSTCSWWVTTYVGKPFATRSANKANSAFYPFEVDKWVVSCGGMYAAMLMSRHLVNAYRVKAGWFIPFVDKCVGGRCDLSNMCHFWVH